MSEDSKSYRFLDSAMIMIVAFIICFSIISIKTCSSEQNSEESSYKKVEIDIVSKCNISFSYDESAAGCRFVYGTKTTQPSCSCKFAKDSKIEERRVRCENDKCKILIGDEK